MAARPGESLDFRDVEAFGDKTAYLLDAGVGIALGDPIKGAFQLLITSEGGAEWKPLVPKAFRGDKPIGLSETTGKPIGLPPRLPAVLAGESAFVASGTALVTHGPRDVWFATGGGRTARVFRSRDRGQTWEVAETPMISAAESAGIFSIAFRDRDHGMIVGGDHKKPSESGVTAAFRGKTK